MRQKINEDALGRLALPNVPSAGKAYAASLSDRGARFGNTITDAMRILLKNRRIRAEVRDRHHVGSVLDEHSGVPMIGMIVVRAMGKDEVRFPLTDQASESAAVLQGGQQLPVVDVENLAGHAKDSVGLVGLHLAPSRERATGITPVADIAIGR